MWSDDDKFISKKLFARTGKGELEIAQRVFSPELDITEADETFNKLYDPSDSWPIPPTGSLPIIPKASSSASSLGCFRRIHPSNEPLHPSAQARSATVSTFRRRLRQKDPQMAVREYTLTGFSDFLERRRVGFDEQLPPNRVCALCGMVPSRSLVLPCGHTLCRLCRSQITEQDGCPLDGRQFADADLLLVVFSEADLEQHRVLCIAGVSPRILRFAANYERRSWIDNDGRRSRVCQERARNAFEPGFERVGEPRNRRQPRQQFARPDLVHPKQRSREADVKDGACGGDWEGASAGSTTKPTVAPGPYRAASKPGVYIETCRFVDVYSAYNAVSRAMSAQHADQHLHSGRLQFKLACELFKNEKKEVCTRFAFILRHGDWDDHVDWPFRKKVTLTIAHPRYEDKDIGMPIALMTTPPQRSRFRHSELEFLDGGTVLEGH
ncbi:hypothetical protein HPB51_029121 [Rhipicephalus microplus]|uniref:RING-type domain-containing protein n=1 Tax=Rhipicephalus microplus TaxID=6941 RepID=A0A9J6CV50_RHIMP|nr:hypothetical protein HPB51_029121 [Rhipicephalus microplus]